LFGLPGGGKSSSLEQFLELVHPDDRAAVRQGYRQSVEKAAELNIEFRVLWPDGTVHWLKKQGAVFHDANGQPLYMTGASMDVTELKELEASAQQRAQELAEADRRKDEFLAMLGHELRNPLAPIRTAAQVLKLKGTTDPDQQWSQEVIDRQVQQLTRLVDDLLDVARITRGKVRLQKERLDLTTILNRAVETSRPFIEARKHRLHVLFPPESVLVDGDPVRLAQVVANLLHNAAKYTDSGGRIWLRGAAAGTDAVIRVRDTGVGISKEMLPHIFEMFTQASGALERAQGGLGIGLTVARRLVEMHNGTIQAYSGGLGRGSEFVVRLPRVVDADNRATPGPTEARRPGVPSGLRVLVVDDNRDAAETLAMLLRAWGHEPHTVHDGPSVLDATRNFRPDVVLLDIGLPGLDGYEVARRLRQDPSLRNIKLIALTGYGQEEDRRRAELAGFDRHLVKPVSPEALADVLRQANEEAA
jgi:two-component system CheB/CheR fusion protein